MRWATWLRTWLRARWNPDAVLAEIEDDIRTHIELDAERLRGEGMTPARALAEAERRFGDRERARRAMRAAALVPSPGSASLALFRPGAYLRHAVRSLLRAPGFAALVVGTLATGVAVNVVVLAATRAVLWGDGGLDDPSRVVTMYTFYPGLEAGMREQPLHGLMVKPIGDVEGVRALAAFEGGHFNLTGRGAPRRLDGLKVTPGLLDVAATRPALGRGFDGVRAGDERAVLLSWELWESLGGDPSLVGSTLTLDDLPYEVRGVMPRGFRFPRGEDVPSTFHFPRRPQVWVAFEPSTSGPSELGMVARVAPGVPVAALQERLHAAMVAWYPGKGPLPFEVRAVPVREEASAPLRPVLLLLAGATGLVLLVGMANVAGAGLARSARMAREMAVRRVMGAGRGAALALFGAEVAVLAALTLGASLLVAWPLAALVRAQAPEGASAVADMTLVGWPLALAAALSVVAALALPLGTRAPLRRLSLADALRDGTRSGGGSLARRLGRWVVAGEVALTLVLLCAGGALTRSLLHLLAVDPGFQPHGVLTAQVTLPEASYPDTARANRVQNAQPPGAAEGAVPAFLRALAARLQALPEVADAGVVTPLPFGGQQEASVFWIDGMTRPQTAGPPFTEYTAVSEGYFAAMGIPLLEGRGFTADDRFDGPPVAVVSRSLADLFPGGRALGGRIKLGGAPKSPYPWLEVVGVVPDVRRTDLAGPPRPEMYVHVSQGWYASMATATLVVRRRTAGPPSALAPLVRATLADLDPDVPLDAVEPMDAILARAVSRERFTTQLLTGFAVASLLIAALGLYTVVSDSVTLRRRELAVRAAVGASGRRVMGTVLREAFATLGVGLALGVGGLAVAEPVLRRVVVGVEPLSGATLLAAVGLLTVATVLAALGPVRRSLRLDPARVLAAE